MKDIWTTFKKVIEKKTSYIPYKVYSNCILENPPKYDIEIEGLTVTLKAGSTIVRGGENNYQTITLENDISATFPSYLRNEYRPIVPTNYGTLVGWMPMFKSVNALPEDSSQGIQIWNSSDRKYYIWDNETQTWNEWGGGYVIGFVWFDENGNMSIAKNSKGEDLIFNGCSLMGHHFVTFPTVRALIPDGFNEDGTLKSKDVSFSALHIREVSLNDSAVQLMIQSASSVYKMNGCYYDAEQNLWLQPNTQPEGGILFANAVMQDGIFKDFIERKPYEDAAEQTLYEPEEYEVEYDRTFLNVGDTAVFKAKNILETQEGSLAYEPDLGIDLKRFLDPDIKIQNRTFEAYSIQKLSEQGINTIELLSNEETFRQLFDFKVAETDKEGMIAQ